MATNEIYKHNMYLSNGRTESGWATLDKLTDRLTKVDVTSDTYPIGGFPVSSDGKTAYVDGEDNHTLIFGSTGSKKSRLIGMPTIRLLAGAGESIVATDPKGELYRTTGAYLREKGYRTVILNFRDPLSGDGWNPLTLPYKYYKSGDTDKAVEMLNDFVFALAAGNEGKDPYWVRSAADFALGLLLILMECCTKPEEVNFSSFVQMRMMGNEVKSNVLGKVFGKLNKNCLARLKMLNTVENADTTRNCILSTLDMMISVFLTQRSLMQMLSASTFDIETIGTEKTAVFLIIPDEKTTCHFLATSFVKQCYETLIRSAQNSPKASLPVRVNFVLDEFANMPEIKDMPSMITAARSRNMRFFLFVQSERQLVSIYGDEAQTIKGNCNNWVFLNSRESVLLNELSELCGQVDGVPLITSQRLQRLDKEKGQALILYGRNKPYITNLADIDDYKWKTDDAPALVRTAKKAITVFDLEKYYEAHKDDIAKLFIDQELLEEASESDDLQDMISKFRADF